MAASIVAGAAVRVVQMDNVFPLGTCINGSVIQDPNFVDFFTNNFDWAVFENELKWYWTEAQRGLLNYRDADALLDFCDRHGKPARGHCIGMEPPARRLSSEGHLRRVRQVDFGVVHRGKRV